jgi:hypothetical protein
MLEVVSKEVKKVLEVFNVKIRKGFFYFSNSMRTGYDHVCQYQSIGSEFFSNKASVTPRMIKGFVIMTIPFFSQRGFYRLFMNCKRALLVYFSNAHIF